MVSPGVRLPVSPIRQDHRGFATSATDDNGWVSVESCFRLAGAGQSVATRSCWEMRHETPIPSMD